MNYIENLIGSECSPRKKTPEDHHRSPYQQDWFQRIAAEEDTGAVIHKITHESEAGSGKMWFSAFKNRAKFTIGHNLCGTVTHQGGPIILSGDKHLVSEGIVRQLPKNIALQFVLASDADYQSFVDHGFKYLVQKNIRIVATDYDTWWKELTTKDRNKFNKGEKDLDDRDMDPDAFVAFYKQNITESGKRPNQNFGAIRRLLIEGKARNQVRILAAYNKGYDVPIAANVTLMSEEAHYNWLTTYRRPLIPNEHMKRWEKAKQLLSETKRQLTKRIWEDATHEVAQASKAKTIETAANKPHHDAVRFLMQKAIQHAISQKKPYDADGAESADKAGTYFEVLGRPADKDHPNRKCVIYSNKHTVYRHDFKMKVWSAFRSPVRTAIKRTIGRLIPDVI